MINVFLNQTWGDHNAPLLDSLSRCPGDTRHSWIGAGHLMENIFIQPVAAILTKLNQRLSKIHVIEV